MLEKYLSIVNHYYLFSLIEVLVLFLLLLIIFLVAKKKNAGKKFMSLLDILVVVLSLGTAVGIYDYCRDVKQVKSEQYIACAFVEAGYNGKFGSSTNIFAAPVVATLDNGEEVYLEDVISFPDKAKDGTIVYLEKSRILLDFSLN